MRLGPEAVASDTSYIPRPEWYYVPIFEWLKVLGGKWSLLGGIVLPGVLALIFAAIPFLDRGRERRPWRRPVVVGGFAMFAACYAALGAMSYHVDATDPIIAKQLAHQKQDEIDFMRQPFEPESPAPSQGGASTALADPLVAKGATIFAAGPCRSCHGDKGQGSAVAPRLIGVGRKFDANGLAYLLHHPTADMIDGGMPTITLNQADTAALVAYLRSLK